MKQETVTINGVTYDAGTGLPVRVAAKTSSTVARRVARPWAAEEARKLVPKTGDGARLAPSVVGERVVLEKAPAVSRAAVTGQAAAVTSSAMVTGRAATGGRRGVVQRRKPQRSKTLSRRFVAKPVDKVRVVAAPKVESVTRHPEVSHFNNGVPLSRPVQLPVRPAPAPVAPPPKPVVPIVTPKNLVIDIHRPAAGQANKTVKRPLKEQPMVMAARKLVMQPVVKWKSRAVAKESVKPAIGPAVRPTMAQVVRPSRQTVVKPAAQAVARPEVKPVVGPTARPMAKAAARPTPVAKKKVAPLEEIDRVFRGVSGKIRREAKKDFRRIKQSKKGFYVVTGAVVVVLIIGILAVFNLPRIEMMIASNHAGVNGSVPTYMVPGYRKDGPVNYAEGQVRVVYWNDRQGEKYQVIEAKTDDEDTELVIGEGAATFVRGGVRYQIVFSALSEEQVRRVAESL